MASPAGPSAAAAAAWPPFFSAAPPRPARVLRLPAADNPRTRRRSVSLRCAYDRSVFLQYTREQLGLAPWAPSVEEILELDETLSSTPDERRERFWREAKEAMAAVKGAAAAVLRPLRDNFGDLRSLEHFYHAEEFHIGMPFGALMACIGVYQLCKVAPSMCLEVALCYAFYKLSVLAADVRRRGFAPDLIIRLKFIIGLAMFFKDIRKNIVPLDYIRLPVLFIYTISVMFDLFGMKKCAKYTFPIMTHDFKTGFIVQNRQLKGRRRIDPER